jgi:hypothetical protein
MSKYFPILALLALVPLASHADDSIIFAADESDLRAFDQMLQSQGERPQAPTPFGQEVKAEAQLLREQAPKGNAMGTWVRDQRRKGNGNVIGGNSSSAPGNSGEARGAAADKANANKGGENKGLGKGHKK